MITGDSRADILQDQTVRAINPAGVVGDGDDLHALSLQTPAYRLSPPGESLYGNLGANASLAAVPQTARDKCCNTLGDEFVRVEPAHAVWLSGDMKAAVSTHPGKDARHEFTD